MVSSVWVGCQFEFPKVGAGGGWLWAHLAPLLLTPCLEHWIVAAFSAFLSVLVVCAIFFLLNQRAPAVNEEWRQPPGSGYYWTTKILTALVAVVALASTGWKLLFQTNLRNAQELVFSLSQFVTWSLYFVAVDVEKIRSVEIHTPLLLVSWILNGLLSIFALISTLLRWGLAEGTESPVDYVLVGVVCAASLFLLVVALVGKTGVGFPTSSSMKTRAQNGHLTDPLLANGDSEGVEGHGAEKQAGLTGHDNAGIFSTFAFLWMNPVLKTGSQKILDLIDVPRLGKANDAEASFAKFKAQWDREGQTSKFLPYILLRAYWDLFALTGVLGLIKLCVMYVGPLLIQTFINITKKEDSRWIDGAGLVGFLFVAKAVEVVCDHQSNFIGGKIGIGVRSSLVSAVYQKGLKITGAARQSHGTGTIVNYMSVDARDVSETCTSLHDLWQLPIQIALALAILYSVVGIATFAGIGTMVFVMAVSLLIASKQNVYYVKIMAAKDRRMKVTNEALGSMKIIKLCAWMDTFLRRVEAARDGERDWIAKILYLAAMSIFFLWLSPLAVSVITFGTCVLLGIPLTAGRVFTAIAVFRIVQEPLRSFPQLIMEAAQALVSIRRIKGYLDSPELDVASVARNPLGGADHAVEVQAGVFKWEPDVEAPTLKNIDFRIRRGSLAAIVGTVGSGKSALLSCVLGEMEKMRGSVAVNGTVAYVPQTAWIQNGTIKDNILFGKAFNQSLYLEALRLCALEGDLAQMIHGDQTEIGERGINLSGGQKQRIQLARALYQDADIYLLDDIFSALDAHTGSAIFSSCVRGIMSRKTVLLVTHQVEYLRGADLILVMCEGAIVQAGQYDELVGEGTVFGALVDAHNENLHSREEVNDEEEEGGLDGFPDEDGDMVLELRQQEDLTSNSGLLDGLPTGTTADPVLIPRSTTSTSSAGVSPSSTSEVGSLGSRLAQEESFQRRLERKMSGGSIEGRSSSSKKNLLRRSSSRKLKSSHPSGMTASTASAKLIEDELREKGQVDRAVYWAYITKIFYGVHVIALVLIQTCWQGLQIASDYWLADSTSETAVRNFEPKRFIVVYSLLAVGSGSFVLARSLLVSFSAFRVAQRFFLDMIRSVFRAPMSFFDTTPAGRVLTRSSTDQLALDFWIPFTFGGLLAVGFQLLGVLAVMAGVTWQLIIIMILLAVVFVQYQRYFIATSRELTRLESVTEAPIIQHFSETIAGFTTVRAFAHQKRFISTNFKLVNDNMTVQFHINAAFEWLGFRLESLGTFILCCSALLLVSLPSNWVQPERVGLSLSYGLALNGCLFSLVSTVSTLEQKMVAVERILQFSKIPSEAPLVIDGHRPEPSWPSKGNVTIKNLSLRYRSDTPLVLKGVSFALKGGEKLGVVGKTGSGKSSLIQALFRIVEPAGGTITVDGVDISTIGLWDLRSKFSIIPQEPTLFEGNVRNNVDPLGEYSDNQIWEALDKCELGDVIRDKEQKLDFVVAENGENWSMGQRQLFCLGRALLRKSRVLVLDEATASVDTQTDIVLQKTISREYANSTIISIAHRIPSVMDSDKVLVLDAGVVTEFGSPPSLLDQSSSMFSALVEEYWNRSNSVQDMGFADEGESAT